MSLKRKIIVVVLSAVLIVGGILVGYYQYRAYLRERTNLVTVVPHDCNSNGQIDLIKVFIASPNRDFSVLQAVDVRGEVLWEATTPAVSSYLSIPSDSAQMIKTNDSLIIGTRNQIKDGWLVTIVSHRLSDGSLTWQNDFQSPGTLGRLLLFNKEEYLISTFGNEHNQTIVRNHDLRTGEVKWQVELKDLFFVPFFHKDVLLLATPFLHILDLKTGVMKKLDVFGMPVPIGDRLFMPRYQESTHTTSISEVLGAEGTVISHPASGLDPNIFSSDQSVASYNNLMLLISNQLNPQRPNTVHAITLPKMKIHYEFDLPDHYSPCTFINEWLRIDPTISAFFQQQTRYSPLILSMPTAKEHWDSYKLVILDQQEGRLMWQSRPIERLLVWSLSDIVYRDGHFFITFDYNEGDTYRFHLLILDGATGHFIDSISMQWRVDENLATGYTSLPQPWQIRGNWLTGSSGIAYWLIDLSTMKLVSGFPASLRLISTRKEVEQHLGPLP